MRGCSKNKETTRLVLVRARHEGTGHIGQNHHIGPSHRIGRAVTSIRGRHSSHPTPVPRELTDLICVWFNSGCCLGTVVLASECLLSHWVFFILSAYCNLERITG
jgi:hypothetical protein